MQVMFFDHVCVFIGLLDGQLISYEWICVTFLDYVRTNAKLYMPGKTL